MGSKKQKGKNINGDMFQDSVVYKNTTYDELIKLLSIGNHQDAMRILKMQENVIGIIHPYYPHYSLGIKRINDDLVPYSKPLTREAMEKYPPRIKGKFSFADKYRDFKNINELLEYSYRTQTDIEINKIELMKMIGDEIDPYQEELASLFSKNSEWKIKPKEFPEARPYRIIIEGCEVSYDYILLRTTRIEDNQVYLSNREQGYDIEFNFIFDLKNKKMSINMKLNKDVKATKLRLKYLKFTKSALSKSKLSIIDLEIDAVLAEAIVDNLEYDSPFGDIDNEITFVEYIALIEEHYNTIIEIPEQIEEDEMEAVYYLGEALKYGEIKGTWKEGTSDFIIVEDSIENIKNLEDNPFDLTLVAPATVSIFEEEFSIPKVIRTFKNAQMENLDNIKKKIAVLEAGDTIKVTFVAKGDNQYTENFDFEKSK